MSPLIALIVIAQLLVAQSISSVPIPLHDVVAQLQRSLPSDPQAADYVIIRGTVVGKRLVTRTWVERSGHESLQSFAEITIEVAHSEILGSVQEEDLTTALVDASPDYYHPRTGDGIRTGKMPPAQPVYHRIYAPDGSEALFVAFRSRDGQQRGSWHPCMDTYFAIQLALIRDPAAGYLAVVGEGQFDPAFGDGGPGELIPSEAWEPELRPVEGSAEDVEAAVIAVVRGRAR